ncbi:MAG: cell division protein FtsZ [Candidatus Micrarchaeota archaeon]|nr:cell division protein FtsZ [Candidatus Micrarchaeota archaeon]MDE1847719.1 cell division protein FtsZ [Candidatus Micrarchaeota archaeon]MDE1864148.1 cell division protein FtsZ [Candidatus Micrarchaeota archaeon]
MDELLNSRNFDLSEAELFKPRIAVAGVGGGGNNTVQRLSTLDVKGAQLFAFNTDNKQLQTLNPNIKKVALGYAVTHGLGAGGFPEMGEKSAELSRNEIDILLRDTNLLFLTAGMGGGTGTGAAPIVADIAKQNGAIVVGIVTIPFSLERSRLATAKKGIERLRQSVDTLIVIDNQRLVNLYPNLQIEQAFKLADEITSRAVRGITEAITQPSMVNIDYADVRTIMQSGGLAVISVGSGQGADRVSEVVRNTLKNKLLDVDYEGATGVLLHITGGPDMTLGEANKIGEMLTESVSPNASVTWGARLENDNQGRVDVIAIFTGVSSPSIFSGSAGREQDSGIGIDRL